MDRDISAIRENVRQLLTELPARVTLVAAAKARRPAAVQAAIEAGVCVIGENYLQEAVAAHAVIGNAVRWHFIGHLQGNKVKRAVALFDVIETVDTLALARAVDAAAAAAGKVMAVLIEVNSGREPQKSGADPEAVVALARQLSTLQHLRLEGLMTVGPGNTGADALRQCFALTARLRDEITALGLPGVSMGCLSMGMTDSYRLAIAEGANMVRLGTRIFGPR